MNSIVLPIAMHAIKLYTFLGILTKLYNTEDYSKSVFFH